MIGQRVRPLVRPNPRPLGSPSCRFRSSAYEYLSRIATSKESDDDSQASKDVAFMVKDSKRFAGSGGWGYGQFNHDPASDSFKPDDKVAKCGASCHSAVKQKDYVFTAFGKR